MRRPSAAITTLGGACASEVADEAQDHAEERELAEHQRRRSPAASWLTKKPSPVMIAPIDERDEPAPEPGLRGRPTGRCASPTEPKPPCPMPRAWRIRSASASDSTSIVIGWSRLACASVNRMPVRGARRRSADDRARVDALRARAGVLDLDEAGARHELAVRMRPWRSGMIPTRWKSATASTAVSTAVTPRRTAGPRAREQEERERPGVGQPCARAACPGGRRTQPASPLYDKGASRGGNAHVARNARERTWNALA